MAQRFLYFHHTHVVLQCELLGKVAVAEKEHHSGNC